MTNTIDEFHKQYYYSLAWGQTYWLGQPVLKCPLDLFIYQEILYEIQPDIILECGTNQGGSALYLASICDLMNKGKIITIDIMKYEQTPSHPRITYFIGNSASEDMLNQVKELISPTDVVLVILDSDHSKQHVLNEMNLYHPLVSIGSYLIVEDTNINGHPVLPDFGPGPMEAVQDFLLQSEDFIIDSSRQKHLLTMHPNGYLKKIK
ncbi:CmcI family methyltransferase [Paenibacillus terrigena]|uniref:CmcI family methyltransferase n=1 Tax=Paenibacillus terrigena TaxID=369333 RepID=UPI0028D90388|nr:CmcI family methyltransferase [Paenibacillus terrigena]